MLAALSMAVFILGWVLHASGTITSPWMDSTSLQDLAGALLAANFAVYLACKR